MTKTETYWIEALVENNDQEAFKQLFATYSARLLAFARSFTADRMLAEEIVNDVFVNLWKNRQQLYAIQNLSYYLYTAVKNTALNYLQKEAKQNRTNFDNIGENYTCTYITPETESIGKENMQQIVSAIQKLLPIPQGAMDKNPKLVQNQGY